MVKFGRARYIRFMNTISLIFFILAGLLAIATLGTVLAGTFFMARSGDGQEQGRRSNKLMRLRIILQAAAIGCIAIALLSR